MLKLSNVEAAYGRILALHGISIEVPDGSIVTVLGANGAGKSTTLRVISGLLPVRSGTVEFLGKPIHRTSAEQLVRLGIAQVPEGRELFPYLTVADNLMLGAYARNDQAGVKQDLERVFAYFPLLRQRLKQVANSLSGGEQQMLAIGRALMSKPSLLLLDEPSLGLAPLVVQEIFSIIRRINQEGTTILLVEQNVATALSIAHFGYVFETGTVAFAGSSQELLRNQEIVRSYLGG